MTPEFYPGYDVLAKREGLSWNDATRQVINERLAVVNAPKYFNTDEWQTLEALCRRIMPQPHGRPEVPLAAYIDRDMLDHGDSGTRIEPMPYDGEAWKSALAALDAESLLAHHVRFRDLHADAADALLILMQKGDLTNPAWARVPPQLFFAKRVLVDIPAAYYAHPTSWSEMGFGGPASPRGYVRMDANRHDAWEATEVTHGHYDQALRDNKNVR
jgi:hypothetical protein